jgi:hypothetical protein
MSDLNFRHQNPIRSQNREEVIVHGTLLGAGTGNPTVSEGAGFSAVRDNTGIYTVTFDRQYAGLVSAGWAIQMGSPAGRSVSFGKWDADDREIEVRVFDLATPSAADVATGDLLSLTFIFRKTGLKG